MLKLSGVSKTFNPGTVNEKKALTDVDLRLERGDFITIVGSNGAGKSTLFNAISGVFFADAGSIVLDGGGHHFPAGIPPQPGDRTALPGPHEGDRPPYDH